MELLQFRYFLEAARYENLTRAADELHIAQPALSQSIMRLENELGVKLFDRRNHHVYLNDQGKLLRKRLIPLMESIDSLKDELWESVCSSEKTISLNFFAASQFITNCIIAYKAEHPDVKFQVSQLETMGGCDIHIDSRASVYGPTAMGEIQMPEGAVRQEILEEEIYLAVPVNSPLAERESVDLRQLREEGYIRLGNGWQLRQICDNFFHQAGVRPQMIFESNSPESVRNLIAAGLGIGFWPERSWDEQPGPQVKLIPIRYPVCRRDVVVTMYHDQGQIALKLVGFQRCITVAGGQPYPIATCAHGTAFDKVGKATATTDSFERAVKAVSRMAIAKRAKKA